MRDFLPPFMAAHMRRLAPALAVALWIATTAATSAYYAGALRELTLIDGANSAAAVFGLLLSALFLTLSAFRRLAALPRAVTVTFAVLALSMPFAFALWEERPEIFAEDRGPLTFRLIVILPAALGLLAALWVRGTGRLASLAAATALGVTYTHAVPELVYEGEFFYASADEEPDRERLDVEALYLAQDRLMTAELAALSPQTPGKPEVFGLVLGGTAHQDVFEHEVENVAARLEQTYDAKGHILHLLNSSAHPLRYPMANRANLRAALEGMAKAMGPEDVAFLYLTSHGRSDRFALTFYEAGTRDLPASELAGMLDDAGLGTAVVVISACYSGSFIDDLSAENRLVMTAARADRTSFGCGNGREWTEFGQSLFERGFSQTADPEAAFEIARKDVWWKELKGLRTGSYPQIKVGAGFAKAFAPVLGAS